MVAFWGCFASEIFLTLHGDNMSCQAAPAEKVRVCMNARARTDWGDRLGNYLLSPFRKHSPKTE